MADSRTTHLKVRLSLCREDAICMPSRRMESGPGQLRPLFTAAQPLFTIASCRGDVMWHAFSSSEPLKALRSLVLGVLVAVAIGGVLWPTVSRAYCGDTNNDSIVSVADALLTLRKAVGQDIDLVCSDEVPENRLSFVNTMTCGGFSFSATFTWSEHPDLVWDSVSDSSYPFDGSQSQEVDDLELGGVLTFDLGDCGGGSLFLDDLG